MYIRVDDKIDADLRNMGYKSHDQKTLKYFGPIDNINIFVGANNSGKSRLLRGILRSKDISLSNLNLVENKINKLKEYIQAFINEISNNRYSKIGIKVTNIGDINIAKSFGENYLYIRKFGNNNDFIIDENLLKGIPDRLLSVWGEDDKFIQGRNGLRLIKSIIGLSIELHNRKDNKIIDFHSLNGMHTFQNVNNQEDHLIEFLNKIKNQLELILSINPTSVSPNNRIYIPILRSSMAIYNGSKKIKTDIFEDTVKKNYYFDGIQTIYFEFHTGMALYESVLKSKANNINSRKLISDFESFLSEHLFENKKVEINSWFEEETLAITIDGEEQEIHEVGDGIQSLIILMFPIFMAKKNTWMFIEEPEMNLHPGMQRLFLEQIKSNPIIAGKNLRFFMTTHSNHLLDLSLTMDKGVSIFSFSKRSANDFLIKNIKNNDIDILAQLGVNNSSVFMANCSIWVEGVSDRRFIKAFLKAYEDYLIDQGEGSFLFAFKEDIHFSFFEYSGSNVS
ncbi:MAG: AAA family ATPase, partial [Saprospiraceae bacterium]